MAKVYQHHRLSEEEQEENGEIFNPYVWLCGKFPVNQNDHKATATALAFYLPEQFFCLISTKNIKYCAKKRQDLYKSKSLFTMYPLNQSELFDNKNYVCYGNIDAIAVCHDDIVILHPKKYCIKDWEPYTSVNQVKVLKKNVETLSNLNKYLNLQNTTLKQDNESLMYENQMLNEEGIEWIWNSIIDTIFAKLGRCAKNNRKIFKFNFKHVCLLLIKNKILCYNNQSRGHKMVKLNINKNNLCFNTKIQDGRCPTWLFDCMLFHGKVLIVKRNSDNTIFRYYECYIQYRSTIGSLTLGGKLKHKTQNVHYNWQK